MHILNQNIITNLSFHSQAGCSCLGCGMKTILRMSSTEEEQVPAEVDALDGVVSDEEVHNKERPSRESGIKKHRKGEKKGTPLAELEVGSFVDGTVKAVTSYGAFVDIGASTDALLHVSRLSNSFVSNVEDVVKTGDSVNVRIVSVDVEKGQVAISMLSEDDENAAKAARGGGRRKERPKRSGADRTSQVETINALAEAGFDDNKMVEGEVVSTLDFGAFVRFDASQLAESVQGELDGLVHISALTAGRADSVTSVVSVGDKVQIRVKGLDTAGNKVSLSMISKEVEDATSRPQKKSDDAKPQRGGRQMFSDSEMGAKDWKDSLQKFQEVNSDFTNMPVIVDKRKTTA
jgi:transcriptional accessory protein Tex/SPT6